MALTGMEAVKVVGHTISKIGEAGEKFENENPGKPWKPTRAEVIEFVIGAASELGVEIQD